MEGLVGQNVLPLATDPTTISQLFLHRVQESGDTPALWVYSDDQNQFVTQSWNDLAKSVWRAIQFLSGKAIQPGDRVVYVAPNSASWIVVDLALQLIGAWHVPLHQHATNQQIRIAVKHTQPKLLICDNRVDLELGDDIDGQCCEIIEQTALDDVANDSPAEAELMAQLKQSAGSRLAHEVCTIVYTSGTSGEPKGVMLTHANLASNAVAVAHAYEEKPADRRLNFLPFSHLYARTCDLYTWIVRGSELVLSRSRETILKDCQATQPSLINAVPYFYQKLLEGLREKQRLQQPDSIRQALGGSVRMCSSGGAKLPLWVIEEFDKQGLLLCEGFGLTETSPVISVSTETDRRPCSVGKVVPGVSLRISSSDEIEVRGPNVMLGYYHDQAATDSVLHDGWLKTGDLGRIDDEGFLWITGRRKEIIALSTGRKFNPVPLELALTADPLIAQAVVCGEGEKCLTVLFVPDPAVLRKRIRAARLWVFSKRQALAHATVQAWFQAALDRCTSSMAEHERMVRFTLLDHGFTPERGEMTAKLSLKREVIAANHLREIRAMYEQPQVSARKWWQVRL